MEQAGDERRPWLIRGDRLRNTEMNRAVRVAAIAHVETTVSYRRRTRENDV